MPGKVNSKMKKFSDYDFDEKISKAYTELLGIDKNVDTGNDSSMLGNEMAWLEQSLKQGGVNHSDINRVSFDNFQKLVDRIGWLHKYPNKFKDEKELADLNRYFEEWLNNAYTLFGKAR